MAEDRVEDLQAAEHLELADFFSSMELARPEVLRDAAAYKVFQSCSEVLREGGGEASFAKSQVTDRIQEFWRPSCSVAPLFLLYSFFEGRAPL